MDAGVTMGSFPFQAFGFGALMILFVMAATSHDFWLANLTAPVWKTLHMLVYVAYLFLVIHVAFGVLQAETHPFYAVLLGLSVLEIVDSKCYLGVMNPGNLKTHRACAINCIEGGIPPVLLVRDREGQASYFLLVGEDGEAVNEKILPLVAEPVSVTGTLKSQGGQRILYADPEKITVE